MLRPLGFRIPQSGVGSIRVKVERGMNFFSLSILLLEVSFYINFLLAVTQFLPIVN